MKNCLGIFIFVAGLLGMVVATYTTWAIFLFAESTNQSGKSWPIFLILMALPVAICELGRSLTTYLKRPILVAEVTAASLSLLIFLSFEIPTWN